MEEALFDEFGDYIGSEPEYADSFGDSDADLEAPGSDEEWEDVNSDQMNESSLSGSVTHSYGPDVEIQHFEIDSQDIDESLVQPNHFAEPEKLLGPTSDEDASQIYHAGLLRNTRLQRSIAMVGACGHGKTTVIDALISRSLPNLLPYCTHVDSLERSRQMTLHMRPICFVAEDSKNKSWAINVLDTPGHADFVDEVVASLRGVEGVVLVVDCVEGLLPSVKSLLKQIQIPLVLVLNKLDRLILDLALPPRDAAARIRAIVEELSDYSSPSQTIFCSAKFGWAFSLSSYKTMYTNYSGHIYGLEDLWTEFPQYILEPLYKLVGRCIVPEEIGPIAAELKISLDSNEPSVFLHQVFAAYFEDPGWSCLWDIVIDKVPPFRTKTDDPENEIAEVVAQFESKALVKVWTPILLAEEVYIGGELICLGELEIPVGRYSFSVESVSSGSLVLVALPSENPPALIGRLSPIPRHGPRDPVTDRIFIIGIEPQKSGSPKSEAILAQALDQVDKWWPSVDAGVLPTGEYTISANGELAIDCFLYDLKRVLPPGVNVRISDINVVFSETVSEQSYAMAPTHTSDGNAQLTVLASPISETLGNVSNIHAFEQIASQAGWSKMDLRNIVALGEGCVLIDDTLNSSGSLPLETLEDGWKWALREGPLIEGRIRQVQFRIVEYQGYADGQQLVVAMRRACRAACLLASPRILEPWVQITVVGKISSGRSIYAVARARRGRVLSDNPIPGTNLSVTTAEIPAIEGIGAESDLRLMMDDAANIVVASQGWRAVLGDPLDKRQTTKRAESAMGAKLARDFMLKTRRRLGIPNDPVLADYVDAGVLDSLEGEPVDI